MPWVQIGARYKIQNKWDGEEYYLQIDSHTMFAKDWDSILIDMLSKLPELSVLTQYPPEYDLETSTFDTSKLRSGLYVEGISPKDNFTRIQSEYINGVHTETIRSEAWGACFSFSKSAILRDAPYDPYLPYLFFGEELDITLRLFTRGWNSTVLINRLCLLHSKRSHRNTIWNDHDNNKRIQLELLARMRLYDKFGINKHEYPQLNKNISKYKLGTLKTFKDYEDFAGIDFKNKTVKGHNKKRILESIDLNR